MGRPDDSVSQDAFDTPKTGRAQRILDAAAHLSTVQWAAVVGVVAALAVIGPGLGPGAWVNLDHSTLPRLAAPNSLFGLGPDVPRRAPVTAVASLFAGLGLSALVLKLATVALFGLAAAGCARWCGRAGRVATLGASALYVLGPFLVNRLVVGHFGVVWAAALLPHAMKVWVDPTTRWSRAFRWAVLLGIGGHLAGTAVLVVLPAVWIVRGLRSGASTIAWVLAGQAVWVVPGAAVTAASHFSQPGAVDFATTIQGWLGPLRLFGGEGFFQTDAGGRVLPSPWPLVIGTMIVGLALLGGLVLATGRRAPQRRLVAWSVAAALGLFITLASTVPGVRGWWNDASVHMPLNMWREGDRAFLVPWMFCCPLIAIGAQRLSQWLRDGYLVALVVPAVMALVLAGPNLWGAEGRLDNVAIPKGWDAARAAILRDPGTTLVVPPSQYLRTPWAGNRKSHQLFGNYVGGDLVASSDAGSIRGGSEVDPRMDRMFAAIVRWGFQPAGELAPYLRASGIKWVVALDLPGANLYVPLDNEKALRPVIQTPGIRLYRVSDVGLAATARALVSAREVWPGLIHVDTSGPVFVARSAAGGWLRGTMAATPAPSGTIYFGKGSRWVWYWPALVTQSAWIVTALLLGCSWGTDVIRRRLGQKAVDELSSSMPPR